MGPKSFQRAKSYKPRAERIGQPQAKASERQTTSATAESAVETGKSNQLNPESVCPPTSATIDAMLLNAKNASTTTTSKVRTNYPNDSMASQAHPSQTIECPSKPLNLHTPREYPSSANLSSVLQSIVEKVDELTRARNTRINDQNLDADSTQNQEEEPTGPRNTGR